jgi:hypothetical protein
VDRQDAGTDHVAHLRAQEFTIRAYAALGQRDRVFERLRAEAAGAVEAFVYSLQFAPAVRAFADDPRLEALYRAAGLRQ